MRNPELSVTILGSGTCVPSLKRSACSALVCVEGNKILLDAGPGTLRRLLEAGVTLFEISHLFLSHFHPDHSGEFVPFLFSTKYPEAQRRTFPLKILAGKGLAAFYEGLQGVYGDWVTLPPKMLEFIELDNKGPDGRGFSGFTVSSMPTAHNPESVALRIESPSGASVVYSGDTDYTEALIHLARGADLLICESALPDEMKVAGHMTPSLVGKVAQKAGVSMVVLTHLYPECDMTDIEEQCRKTFSGRVKTAFDLMTLHLGPGGIQAAPIGRPEPAPKP